MGAVKSKKYRERHISSLPVQPTPLTVLISEACISCDLTYKWLSDLQVQNTSEVILQIRHSSLWKKVKEHLGQLKKIFLILQ